MLSRLEILPFNIEHAKIAGTFANYIFSKKDKLNLNSRNIIPNDTKLFAQASYEASIQYYLTSDKKSFEIYELLRKNSSTKPKFQFIDLKIPHNETFGLLEL